MLPDRVSNPGPLTYEAGALPIAIRSPGRKAEKKNTVGRRWWEANIQKWTVIEFASSLRAA